MISLLVRSLFECSNVPDVLPAPFGDVNLADEFNNILPL